MSKCETTNPIILPNTPLEALDAAADGECLECNGYGKFPPTAGVPAHDCDDCLGTGKPLLTFVVPIEGIGDDPKDEFDDIDDDGDLWFHMHVEGVGYEAFVMHPPYPLNEPRPVGEEWGLMQDEDENYPILHRDAVKRHPPNHMAPPRSPATMPPELAPYCRFLATPRAVEVKRVKECGRDVWVAMGYVPREPRSESIAFVDEGEIIEVSWDAHHPEHPWEGNPFILMYRAIIERESS